MYKLAQTKLSIFVVVVVSFSFHAIDGLSLSTNTIQILHTNIHPHSHSTFVAGGENREMTEEKFTSVHFELRPFTNIIMSSRIIPTKHTAEMFKFRNI